MAMYEARVRTEATTNPGLQPLLHFLGRQHTPSNFRHGSRLGYIEHLKDTDQPRHNPNLGKLADILTNIQAIAQNETRAVTGCTIIIEDIQPDQVEELGGYLNIDPEFFANNIGTNYRELEQHTVPVWAIALPSECATKESVHIHFQRIVELQKSSRSSTCKILNYFTNSERAVKRLPPLNGVDIALARTCSSVLRKRFDSGFWLCLILVDKNNADVVSKSRLGFRTSTAPIAYAPLHISGRPPPNSLTALTAHVSSERPLVLNSPIFDHLMVFIMSTRFPMGSMPGMLSLCFHSLRVALKEWMMYSITMDRYVKHYEYSLSNVYLAFNDGDDAAELQTWRRRAFQTLQNLSATQAFVEYWNTVEDDPEPGDWLIKDMQHISQTIAIHSRSLENMIPVATSMAQLFDTRRSMAEASHVKQLTYVALVFIPLSYVSSLFSMSDKVAPWSAEFWLYFAVAVPLLLIVLGLSWWRPSLRFQ